jgi:hypothetical protein
LRHFCEHAALAQKICYSLLSSKKYAIRCLAEKKCLAYFLCYSANSTFFLLSYKKRKKRKKRNKKKKTRKEKTLTRCGSGGLFFTNERYSFARDIVFGR